MLSNIEIEKIEEKYLKKFFYLMKSFESEMMEGFQTKEEIKDDWIHQWEPTDQGKGKGISNFATGAERIVYALFNGKSVGFPNSSPVGSDLFFETSDAYIHIDLKTVQTRNIGDYIKSIFVGENQNSYKGQIKLTRGVDKGTLRNYIPALPTFYNKSKQNAKICLSYFITILYEEENLNILNINIISMPNGELESHYGTKVLQAGKNKTTEKIKKTKTRFRFSETPNFELLEKVSSRIKVIYFDENMKEEFKKKLNFHKNIYDKQDN